MTIGKVHKTRRFDRLRVREPSVFIKGSFRTHDIGRKGFSKRIAGRLKSTGRWATQSILVSHDEPVRMKQRLLLTAVGMVERVKGHRRGKSRVRHYTRRKRR